MPICTCLNNYVGDAFTECKLQGIYKSYIQKCKYLAKIYFIVVLIIVSYCPRNS